MCPRLKPLLVVLGMPRRWKRSMFLSVTVFFFYYYHQYREQSGPWSHPYCTHTCTCTHTQPLIGKPNGPPLTSPWHTHSPLTHPLPVAVFGVIELHSYCPREDSYFNMEQVQAVGKSKAKGISEHGHSVMKYNWYVIFKLSTSLG